MTMRRSATSAILFASLLSLGATAQAQDQSSANAAASSVISGRVTTREGEPLTNARVSIGRLNATVNLAAPSQTVRVDSGGAFKTEPLEPGLYWLGVYAPGYIQDSSQRSTSSGFYRPGDNVTFTMIKGGVITGTVKNSNNEPMIAIQVRAIRVRDSEGKPLQFTSASRERPTDDRGIYRLYGLLPGTYIVSAGGASRTGGVATATPYEFLVPTFAPSSPRDAAVEIPLTNGDEVTADIQFRGEAGHSISGSIAGAATDSATSWAVGVSLFDLRNHADAANASATSTNNYAFAFYGVPDGEYEISSSLGSASGDMLASPPKQIKVQGANVTGINLTVAPLASIDGRVTFEPDPKAACGERRASIISETFVYARRYQPEETPQSKAIAMTEVPSVYRNSVRQLTLDARGSFTFRNVQPGNYRIDPREPAPGWYVRSITLGTGKNVSVVRDGVLVKPSEHVSGLTVTIAEGAAKLRGKITLAEGQSLSANLRVYMIPAERENADNVLRFYEARPDADRSFTIDNVAPGRYLIVARLMEQNDFGVAKSIRQDGSFRANVVHDAEALKKDVAFKPCEQLADYQLPYSPPTSSQ
jgi:protocatechuate 3,4-dioxygenase beta subunit